MTKKNLLHPLIVLTAVASFAIPTWAQSDEPNLKKEEYFHRIYKTYNEQPTSESTWEQVVGDRQSQVYKVQKGDTLSDISRTFFGDPNYWPKIWSLNSSYITNPHEISPLMNIQFYPGTMSEAPTVDLAQNSEGQAPEKDEPAPADQPALPKGRERSKVLKEIPSSLPVYRYGKVLIPRTSLTVEGRRPVLAPAPEYLTYYISESVPTEQGVVRETELGLNSASEYQYIVVKLEGGESKNYVAFRELPQVADPAQTNKSIKAHLIEYQGGIEILEKVNDSENLYRAIVKKTIAPIQVGAKLIPGSLPMFDPTPTSVGASGGGMIIGGPFSSQRALFGSKSLVFLNNGSSGGFQEGQSLAIYRNIKKRLPNSKSVTNDRQVGVVKIIKISGDYVTGYITNSTDDITVGDYVGSPSMLSSSSSGDFESSPAEKAAEPKPEAGGLDEELDF